MLGKIFLSGGLMSSLHLSLPSVSAAFFSVASNEKSVTHRRNASRPPPARNWVYSGRGNEREIAARRRGHTLRC